MKSVTIEPVYEFDKKKRNGNQNFYVAFRTVCNIFWGKVDFGPFDFGQVW